MYDFSNLTKAQLGVFDDFKLSLCSVDTPLSKTSNEDNLRTRFENELNSLLRRLGFIGEDYEIFEHETANESGRTDFQYGNTIIEYKAFSLLSNKDKLPAFQEQIQKYLKAQKFSGFKMFGFLFDGLSLHSYTKDENDKIIYNVADSGKLTSINLDKMIKTIFQSGIVAISPNNLQRDFGIIDKYDKLMQNDEVLSLNKHLLKVLTSTTQTRTKLLFSEWEKMFRLAESDSGQHQDIFARREVFAKIFGIEIDKDNEYKALFALHTSLSIIIKLLLTNFISTMPNFIGQAGLDDFYKSDSISEVKNFFASVENGLYFSKIGIVNLVDSDFFSWYIKEPFDSEIKEILQKLIFKICSYENIHLTQNSAMLDMFKGLYLNFIPKCVRHSFGEYYTPQWLAERTFLSATSEDENLSTKSFIDPSCGSGTFLSVFFNEKHKNLNEKVDFADFAKGIVGVDINPIAVLMARANILIQAIKRCKFNPAKRYEVPVYLADSLYVPSIIKIGKTECYDYELYTTGLQEEFNIDKVRLILPKKLVLTDDFINIITKIEQEIVKLDKKAAFKIFARYCEEIKENSALEQTIKQNIDELIKFEDKKLNSIWLKIFSNYFRVASFEKFDYIIGNPAWVQWSVLPESYRNNIKANMRIEGLFSSDKNVGGNNLNICALIANKCCERWLKDDGKFAFLMPKSILFNKSFEGFRNLVINGDEKLYFNEVLDFSDGGEIFEGVGLDFCSFKISKTPNKQDDIVSVINHSRKVNTGILTQKWMDIKDSFEISNHFAVQLKTELNNNFLIVDSVKEANQLKGLLGKCDYRFRKGVSIPFLMRLQFIAQKDDKIGIFHPYEKYGRIKPNLSVKIELELEFVKPFVDAPMLADNGFKWENDYCICPYLPNTKKPLAKEDLNSLAPHIYAYAMSVDDRLGKGSKFNKRVQNFDEKYGILRMGDYVWAEHFVCIRDNTKLNPTYIGKITTHWGEEKAPLFDNHISFVSEVKTDKKSRFIDKDEAKYILETLQNKAVRKIIEKSQDSRSISSRLPIRLPLLKA